MLEMLTCPAAAVWVKDTHPSGEPSKHFPEQTVNRHLVKLLLLSRQDPVLSKILGFKVTKISS